MGQWYRVLVYEEMFNDTPDIDSIVQAFSPEGAMGKAMEWAGCRQADWVRVEETGQGFGLMCYLGVERGCDGQLDWKYAYPGRRD